MQTRLQHLCLRYGYISCGNAFLCYNVAIHFFIKTTDGQVVRAGILLI